MPKQYSAATQADEQNNLPVEEEPSFFCKYKWYIFAVVVLLLILLFVVDSKCVSGSGSLAQTFGLSESRPTKLVTILDSNDLMYDISNVGTPDNLARILPRKQWQ